MESCSKSGTLPSSERRRRRWFEYVVWFIPLFFFAVLFFVVIFAHLRPSHSTALDKMRKLSTIAE